MGLREQQDLLARLYTSAECRSAFASDPSAIGSAAGLSDDEVRDISSTSLREIGLFSESLFWKRFGEAEKLLPVTSRALGTEFAPRFRAFSGEFNPQSAKKHLEDAIEFCRVVRKDDSVAPHARDAAEFEQKKLEFFSGARRFLLIRATYDLAGSKPPVRRRSLTVWLRFRGRIHRFGR